MDKDWDSIERRRYVREKFPYTVHIHVFLPKKRSISTYTENISVGGIRIVIREELDNGAIVDMAIYMGPEPFTCKGKVIWVREKTSSLLGTKLYDTGISFWKLEEKNKQAIIEHVRELEETQSQENTPSA